MIDAQDRGDHLLSVIWTQLAISFAFVAFRFYCRTRDTRNVWWDDWCCLAAFQFIVIFSIILSIYARGGGNAHRSSLQSDHVPWLTELNFISQVFQVMALVMGKISVALLTYRLQPPTKWRTWLLSFLSISSFVIAILVIVVFFAQCQPTSALWNPGTGTCWKQTATNDWIVAAGSYWALVDLVLALLPITFLYKLQISWKRRMILCMLLGLGVFAAVCAAIKVAHIRTLTTNDDITWNTTSLLIWNTTEANVIVYAACIPTVSELFQQFYGMVLSHTVSRLGMSKYFSSTRNHKVTYRVQHIKLESLTDEESRIYRARIQKSGDEAMIISKAAEAP